MKIWSTDEERLHQDCIHQVSTYKGGKLGIWGGIGLMQKYPPIFKKMFLNDVALLWMRGFHAYDTASVS